MGRMYQTMAYDHQTILAKAIARAELCRICLGRSLLDSHVLGLAHSWPVHHAVTAVGIIIAFPKE